MKDLALQCSCGKVRAVAHNIAPESGTRLVCYCSDCREFLVQIGSEKYLDEWGGADNFQMPIGDLKFTQGIEQVRCLRLTEKGMHRWYTECCKTPIGNTVSPGVPFIALFHAFIADKASLENNWGPVRGYLKTSSATSPVPQERARSSQLRPISRAVFKLVIWKLTGRGTPNPLFDRNKKPISEPTIVHPLAA